MTIDYNAKAAAYYDTESTDFSLVKTKEILGRRFTFRQGKKAFASREYAFDVFENGKRVCSCKDIDLATTTLFRTVERENAKNGRCLT